MKETRNQPGAFYEEALRIMNSPETDISEATRLLKLGVDANDPFAKYALGTWHFHGSNGIRKNRIKGMKLIQSAADAKVPDALFDLAVCLEVGEVVKQDLNRAFLCYLDAAIRGDGQAIFEVARCYTYGIGIDCAPQIAEIWSDRADELGTFEEED
jgi:uncharacterized protein